MKIKIEDNLLDSFELNSPEILELQENVNQLKSDLNDYLPPDEAPDDFIDETYEKIKQYSAQAKTLKQSIDGEFETWFNKLDNADTSDDQDDANNVDLMQQRQLAERMKKFFLDELGTQIEAAQQQYESPLDELDILIERIDPTQVDLEESDRVKRWKKLQLLINAEGGLLDRVTTLFVQQEPDPVIPD